MTNTTTTLSAPAETEKKTIEAAQPQTPASADPRDAEAPALLADAAAYFGPGFAEFLKQAGR